MPGTVCFHTSSNRILITTLWSYDCDCPHFTDVVNEAFQTCTAIKMHRIFPLHKPVHYFKFKFLCNGLVLCPM